MTFLRGGKNDIKNYSICITDSFSLCCRNNFYKRMDLTSRKEVMSELDRSECLKLYKEYAAIEDKKEY